MRPNVTLSVALLLVVAAVAAPIVAARAKVDKDACSTTETSSKTTTVLDNGTRKKTTTETHVVECPGTADDVDETKTKVAYDEDYDGPDCDTERTVVEKEHTLTNGTEVRERTVTESRDCPGSEDDFSRSSTHVRYHEAKEKDEDENEEEDEDASEETSDDKPRKAKNETEGRGHGFGWYDEENRTGLIVDWKERDNGSRGRAHAFGQYDNETKVEMKAKWKETDKGSWFHVALKKIRGEDAEDAAAKFEKKAEKAQGGDEHGKRKGFREAMKHVPADVAAKFQSILNGLWGRARDG